MFQTKSMCILGLTFSIALLGSSCSQTKFAAVDIGGTKTSESIKASDPVKQEAQPSNSTPAQVIAPVIVEATCPAATHETIQSQCLVKCRQNQTRNAALRCIDNVVVINNNPPACNSSQHLENNQCVSNRRSCSSRPEGTFGGFEEWQSGSWSSCKDYLAATCIVQAQFTWGGGCGGSNASRTLAFGESMTINNSADTANSGSIVLKCVQSSQQNGPADVQSNNCDPKPIYQFRRMDIQYSGTIRHHSSRLWVGNMGYVDGTVTEASDPTYFAGTSNVAYLEDITARDQTTGSYIHSITTSFTNPDISTVASVQLIECNTLPPFDCRTGSINPSDLEWSVPEAHNGLTIHSSGSNWLCADAGMSVADKRGLLDCAARGSVVAQVHPRTGQISVSNTRGAFEDGRFVIHAKIRASTPNYSKYAGNVGEYVVQVLNRPDIKVTSNMTDFSGYGRMIHYINGVGTSGYNDSVTLQSKSCSVVTAAGQSLAIQWETYNGNNQFSITPAALASLPVGVSRIKITCTANAYGGLPASDAHYVTVRK